MQKMVEFAKRRKELMRQVGSHGIIIVPSATEAVRTGDTFFAFRQNSDFYYLTGFEEPEAVLVLAPKRAEGEYILFNRVRDPDKEIWDGPRAGQQGACNHFLTDQSFPISEFGLMLPDLLVGREAVYYPLGMHREFDKVLMHGVNKMRAKIRNGTRSPITFVDIAHLLHEMRLLKSPAELLTIQKAVDISVQAHRKAMQVCKPDMYEYELEAELIHEFVRHGARFSAYSSIVGAGANSCVLHYISNNHRIREGDIVLIDAGCEYQNYASDITRSFPANGRFSAEQRAIYEIVLAAQLAAINSIKPGVPWTMAQDIIVKTLTQGLVDLRILKGSVDSLIEQQAHFPFYMHRSGHWLGLDVHDVGSYRIESKWRPLRPDMVLTVEPGLYLSATIPKLHERWHNIGVRIEDDVLVTAKNSEVLSQALPKTVADIEAVMADRR